MKGNLEDMKEKVFSLFHKLCLATLILVGYTGFMVSPVLAADKVTVNGEPAETVAAALESLADNATATIKILESHTDNDSHPAVIKAGQTITLDLNGLTYSGACPSSITNRGTLIIENSKPTSAGSIQNSYVGENGTCIFNATGATLVFSEVESGSSVDICNSTYGVFNEGGTLINTGFPYRIHNCSSAGFYNKTGDVNLKNACIYANTEGGIYIDTNGLISMGPNVTNNDIGSGTSFDNVNYDLQNKALADSTDKMQLCQTSAMARLSVVWKNADHTLTRDECLIDKSANWTLKSDVSDSNPMHDDDKASIKKYSDLQIYNNGIGLWIEAGKVTLTGEPFNTHVFSVTTEWTDENDKAGLRPTKYRKYIKRPDADDTLKKNYQNFTVLKENEYATVRYLPTYNSAGELFNAVKSYRTNEEDFYLNNGEVRGFYSNASDYNYEVPAGNLLYESSNVMGTFEEVAGNRNAQSSEVVKYTMKDPVNEMIDLVITITWNDNDDNKGRRPDSVDVLIYQNDDTSTFKTETIKATDGWTKTVSVPKYVFDEYGYDTTVKNTYKVTQTPIEYYDTTAKAVVVKTNEIDAEIVNVYTGDLPHPVTISVVDPYNKGIKGAVVAVYNSDGNVVHQGTTDTNGEIKINLPPGDYTMKQISAPRGYLLNTDTFAFTMNENGSTTGSTKIRDDVTRVVVKRIDSSTRALVAGAHLRLRGEDGVILKDWTSSTSGYNIEGELEPDTTYYVTEVNPPKNYQQATEVAFKTNKDGKTKEVIIGSAAIKTTTTPTPTPTPIFNNGSSMMNRTPNTGSAANPSSATAARNAAGTAGTAAAANTAAGRSGEVVKTGDESRIRMYFIGSLASIFAIAFAVFLIHKKRKEGQKLAYLADMKGYDESEPDVLLPEDED